MPKTKSAHFHTTIKVTSDLRDRLKTLAEAEGRTLGGEIEHLVELAERHARMDLLAAQVAATSEEDMAAYREEIKFWDAVSADWPHDAEWQESDD